MLLEFQEKILEKMTFAGDGQQYEFYFREPSTTEKISYMAASVQKKNGHIDSTIERMFQTKYEYGLKLLTGFPKTHEDGSIQFSKKDGTPIASDPEDEHYDRNWKELIGHWFYDKIILKATQYYEGISEEVLNERIKHKAEETVREELDDSSPL